MPFSLFADLIGDRVGVDVANLVEIRDRGHAHGPIATIAAALTTFVTSWVQ